MMMRGGTASTDPYKHYLSYLVGGILNMPELFFPIVSIVEMTGNWNKSCRLYNKKLNIKTVEMMMRNNKLVADKLTV